MFDKEKGQKYLSGLKKFAAEAIEKAEEEAMKKLEEASSEAAKKVGNAAADAGSEIFKKVGDLGAVALKEAGAFLGEYGAKTAEKLGLSPEEIAEKAKKIPGEAGEKARKIVSDLNTQKKEIQEKGFSEVAIQTTQNMLSAAIKLPLVKVDREEFLRKTFGSSPYIDQIVEKGPLAVYTLESVRKKADDVIKSSTRKTTVASFASGLPSNIAIAIAAGGIDIVQYFGFAINLAQKIAYLFGEDDLFKNLNPAGDITNKEGEALPEDAQIRIITYLGAMLGVNGASGLIIKTTQKAGEQIGKKVAQQALTKTVWYPVFKKVASILGYKVTKKTVESIISKAMPVVGGVISGGLTYATFKPLGRNLADVFVKIINGEFNIELELNPEFEASIKVSEKELDTEFIDVEYQEVVDDVPNDCEEINY